MKDYIVDRILFGDGEKLQVRGLFREPILDSSGLSVITFMEQRFGIEIADDEVIPENFDTLRKMSEFVERKMNGRTAA
jgi:acyl carrier protein